MAPRGMEECVKSVMVAAGKGLEGRGIAVHFVHKAYDILVVSLYCHVGSREVEKQKNTERKVLHLGQVSMKVSARQGFIRERKI